jgi:hypothetical protein
MSGMVVFALLGVLEKVAMNNGKPDGSSFSRWRGRGGGAPRNYLRIGNNSRRKMPSQI